MTVLEKPTSSARLMVDPMCKRQESPQMTAITITYNPDEWQLVPKVPTEEMVFEVENAARFGGIWTAKSTYQAMLQAAPQPEPVQSDAVKELVEVLTPFARAATVFDDDRRGANMPASGVWQSWPRLDGDYELTVEDLRIARATLAKHGGGK